MLFVFGTVSAFISIALGAFAAHGLKASLDTNSLNIFRTGVQYQMVHAVGFILLGLWQETRAGRSALFSASCFGFGSVFFSGSLYLLALTGIKWLGAITPLGGLAFLAGWLAWGASSFREMRR